MQALNALLPQTNIQPKETSLKTPVSDKSDKSQKFSLNSKDPVPAPNKGTIDTGNTNNINPENRVAEQKATDNIAKPKSFEKSSDKKLELGQSDTRITKEKALEVFAKKMQQEFNISPEQVIVAFSEMSPEQLAEAPVLSAAQFVEKLPLNPEQKVKAHEIYTEMLAWTATAGVTNELGSKGQTAQIKVTTEKEQMLKTRLDKLNNLSDKFFMSGNYDPTAAAKPQTGEQLMDSIVTANQAAPENMTEGEQLLESMDFEVMQEVPVPAEGLEAKQATPLINPAANAELAKAATELDALDVSPDQEMENIEKLLSKLADSTGALNESLSTDKDAQLDAGTDKDADMSDADMSQDLNSLAVDNNKEVKTKGEFAKMVDAPTKTEMNENVTQIMNKAQALVRDGGGEMKVRLNPEGMGEVNLKVSVHKGEVQIEMMAADHNTKKLLESSLADLKDSLMSHKLQVDNIKVETANHATNNFMNDQRESAERQFQQRFLQDFMQNNNQRRGAFMDFGSAMRPSSQTDEAINGLYNPYKRQAQSDRKLDLVA